MGKYLKTKSRECHKLQPIPNTNRKRKETQINTRKEKKTKQNKKKKKKKKQTKKKTLEKHIDQFSLALAKRTEKHKGKTQGGTI